MRHPSRRVLSATIVVALLGIGVAGCGGGDDDSLQQAMAQQFRIVVGLNDEDSYCYAGELLDYYGADEMQRFVDNPDEFQPSTPTDQAVLLDALESCGIDPLTLQAGRGSGAEIELERVEDPASATTAAG
jgi:hypothetical protein